jgi:hypothetical protein
MPNLGPKVEKKATGMIPRRLMKKMVRSESTNPKPNTGTASTPMAKDETTMLAAHHCGRR